MERTIRVTGKGKISIKPDTIRLLLTLESTEKEYEKTLDLSATQTQSLKNCLERIGFEATDLKTLSFNIDTEYESYEDENHVWKQRFSGYKLRHDMKLEFQMDQEKLGKVLYQLSHCPASPEFRIQYTVKDGEAAKNILLANAVSDSVQKAQVIAKAAGVELGQIVSLDYSWENTELTASPMRKLAGSMAVMQDNHSYHIGIEPDDIDVSDTVTVVWALV